VTLTAEDVVILTSDGVVEAKTASGELFGFERLEQTIATGPATTPQTMLDHPMNEVASFSQVRSRTTT
jgi:serine phosphatase RsbU (regulator of sigma subunit)